MAAKAKKKKAAPKAAKKKTPAKKTKPAPAKKIAASSSKAVSGALLTPLEDRLLIQPEEASGTTASGLIIPGSVTARPNRGLVLAKGRGRRNKKGALRPLDVNVGDHVLFADYAGTKLTVAGKEVLILREEDVLGIVS